MNNEHEKYSATESTIHKNNMKTRSKSHIHARKQTNTETYLLINYLCAICLTSWFVQCKNATSSVDFNLWDIGVVNGWRQLVTTAHDSSSRATEKENMENQNEIAKRKTNLLQHCIALRLKLCLSHMTRREKKCKSTETVVEMFEQVTNEHSFYDFPISSFALFVLISANSALFKIENKSEWRRANGFREFSFYPSTNGFSRPIKMCDKKNETWIANLWRTNKMQMSFLQFFSLLFHCCRSFIVQFNFGSNFRFDLRKINSEGHNSTAHFLFLRSWLRLEERNFRFRISKRLSLLRRTQRGKRNKRCTAI